MTKLNDIGDWHAYQCGFGQWSVSYMGLRLDCEGRLDDCHNISSENVNPVQKLLCPTQSVYAYLAKICHVPYQSGKRNNIYICVNLVPTFNIISFYCYSTYHQYHNNTTFLTYPLSI